jgi:hypothetical protein
VAWNASKTCVEGDGWSVERFRRRDIGNVVRRQVVAQVPDASQEWLVGVGGDIESPGVFEAGCGKLGIWCEAVANWFSSTWAVTTVEASRTITADRRC